MHKCAASMSPAASEDRRLPAPVPGLLVGMTQHQQSVMNAQKGTTAEYDDSLACKLRQEVGYSHACPCQAALHKGVGYPAIDG